MRRHKTGTVEITINYGYDINSIKLSKKTFDRITRGEKVKVRGQGLWGEEGRVQDYWIFTKDERKEEVDVYVYYDDGGELYQGPWLRVDPPEAYHPLGSEQKEELPPEPPKTAQPLGSFVVDTDPRYQSGWNSPGDENSGTRSDKNSPERHKELYEDEEGREEDAWRRHRQRLRQRARSLSVTSDYESLIAYCRENNRVCPLPQLWSKLWEMLPNRSQVGGRWRQSSPLILAAWHDTPAMLKMLRSAEHIQWAEQYGALESVSAFLRGLAERDWFHIGD